MPFGLSDTAIQKIQEVLSRHPAVERAVLYGSRAKGNHKNGSDIDLTLCGGEAITLNELYRIMDELDDLLLPHTIDLSILASIQDRGLLDHIQRVGIPFYERAKACD